MTTKALQHKPLTEIICTKQDVIDFISWLREAQDSLQKNEPNNEQDASLSIDSWWDDKQFAIEIYSNLSTKNLLKGKIYRAFDLYYNKTEISTLAQKLERQMNETSEKTDQNKTGNNDE